MPVIKNEIILAIAKGRISHDLIPLLKNINLKPDEEFFDDKSRKLIFSTNIRNLKIIKVRSFDVANFVKFGGADLGICGLDVLEEFKSNNIYRILDLNIGKCRLSIASRKNNNDDFSNKSHIKIATKYINITHDYFSKIGIQAESIKLNGSIELAPNLNLCDYIVDLVDSGRTLLENNLKEMHKIIDVSSYLISNSSSFTIKKSEIIKIINIFKNELHS